MKFPNKIFLYTILCFGLGLFYYLSLKKNSSDNEKIATESSSEASQHKKWRDKNRPMVDLFANPSIRVESNAGAIPANSDNTTESPKPSAKKVDDSTADPYENPKEQKIANGEGSPDSIFTPSKFTVEQIKEKLEASLDRLDFLRNSAKVENIECTEESCSFETSEKLPEDVLIQLYDYYGRHPQYGKWIESHRSKDDPNRIIYSLTDKDPEGVPWATTKQ